MADRSEAIAYSSRQTRLKVERYFADFDDLLANESAGACRAASRRSKVISLLYQDASGVSQRLCQIIGMASRFCEQPLPSHQKGNFQELLDATLFLLGRLNRAPESLVMLTTAVEIEGRTYPSALYALRQHAFKLFARMQFVTEPDSYDDDLAESLCNPDSGRVVEIDFRKVVACWPTVSLAIMQTFLDGFRSERYDVNAFRGELAGEDCDVDGRSRKGKGDSDDQTQSNRRPVTMQHSESVADAAPSLAEDGVQKEANGTADANLSPRDKLQDERDKRAYDLRMGGRTWNQVAETIELEAETKGWKSVGASSIRTVVKKYAERRNLPLSPGKAGRPKKRT